MITAVSDSCQGAGSFGSGQIVGHSRQITIVEFDTRYLADTAYNNIMKTNQPGIFVTKLF
jgi:hypothetical protein